MQDSVRPIDSLVGVVPVLSTPFDRNGAIDADTLEKEVAWVHGHGIKVIATGMVSEILRMNIDERKELTSLLATFAGRNQMFSIVSCGQETTAATINLVNHAEKVGATAAMINPPISVKLSEEETHAFFANVFENTNLPIVVQDASGYVGNSIPLNVLIRLFSQYEEKILFKPEAVPIGQRLSALRDATSGRARIFEGTGGAHLVDSYKRGIVGTMPGADLCWAISQLWRALEQGNWDKVNLINGPVANMVNLLTNLDAYVVIEKHLLKLQGVFSDTYRKEPFGFNLDEETRLEAERIFRHLQAVATE